MNLSQDFNGLQKTFCARSSAGQVDVVLMGDATETVLPPDVLESKGQLYIGVYAADTDGNIVIPTIWAYVGVIKQGTVPSGVYPSGETPAWAAQVQAIAEEALERSAPSGGTTGQALVKASDDDFDYTWGNIMAEDDGAGNVTIYMGVN